jgi:hypothetical protein
MTPLTPADFPLLAIGACVYRRTLSSPLFTALSAEIAADLAFRLNSQECEYKRLASKARAEAERERDEARVSEANLRTASIRCGNALSEARASNAALSGLLKRAGEAMMAAIADLSLWSEQETGERINNPGWNAILCEIEAATYAKTAPPPGEGDGAA